MESDEPTEHTVQQLRDLNALANLIHQGDPKLWDEMMAAASFDKGVAASIADHRAHALHKKLSRARHPSPVEDEPYEVRLARLAWMEGLMTALFWVGKLADEEEA
jgi:hypothetical protein